MGRLQNNSHANENKMVVHRLSLKNFRNYKELEVEFNPKINFFLGNNGQGKTNLLEALYYFTHLKSFRTSTSQNLLFYGADSFAVNTTLKKKGVTHDIRIQLQKEGKKVFLNNKKVSLTSEFICSFFSLIFSPDQIASFKEFPAERRMFFDRVLSFLSEDYFQKLKEFSRIRKNKNFLLKEKKIGELLIWNKLLSEVIPTIISSRREFIGRINQLIAPIFYSLTEREEKLQVEYKTDFQFSEELKEDELFHFFQSKIEKEIVRGHMIYGPQRDSYWMTLDGKEDKKSFSQGEYRIASLALKLSVNHSMEEKLNFFPILLLDDVFSELDQRVCDQVIDFIFNEKNQVFITTTQIPEKYKKLGKKFIISDGEILKD